MLAPSVFRQLIDYVRVYQIEGEENWGCDPDDYPTADYIDSCVSRLSFARSRRRRCRSLTSSLCALSATPRLIRTPTTRSGATQASTGRETGCTTVAKGRSATHRTSSRIGLPHLPLSPPRLPILTSCTSALLRPLPLPLLRCTVNSFPAS